MFGVATLVFLIVIAALGVAALRRNRKDTTPPMSHERDETHRGAKWIAVTAGATALIVAAFLGIHYVSIGMDVVGEIPVGIIALRRQAVGIHGSVIGPRVNL